MYFTGGDDYQNFLVFAPVLSSIILDSNKKFTNWILIRMSSEKNEPFDINLKATMSNLASRREILKFNNSILMQKSSYSLYSNFILNLYIVYELKNWLRNPINNFPQKPVCLVQSN